MKLEINLKQIVSKYKSLKDVPHNCELEVDSGEVLANFTNNDLIDELDERGELPYADLCDFDDDELSDELKQRGENVKHYSLDKFDVNTTALKYLLCDRYSINHHVSILELMGKLLSEFINSNLLDTKIK